MPGEIAGGLRRLAAQARSGRGGYVAALVTARIVNAAAGLLMVWRFPAETVGGYNYLQATAAIPVGLCAFGIDLSVNALVSRQRAADAPLLPVALAGLAVIGIGALLCIGVVALLLLVRNPAVDPPIVAGCLIVAFCAVSFLNLYVNGLNYAAGRYLHVGAANLLATALFLTAVLGLGRGAGSQTLLALVTVTTLAGTLAQSLALRGAGGMRALVRRTRTAGGAVAGHVRTLLVYGGKQALLGTIGVASLWLIQARIADTRGLSATALYGVANQLFNLVIFFPSILNPILLAAIARRDRPGARALCARLTTAMAVLAVGIVGAAAALLPFVEPWLPAAYRGLTLIGTLAAAAAALQLVKAPASLSFVTQLRAGPEFVATAVLVGVTLAGIALLDPLSPATAMALRLAAQAAATLATILLFAFDRTGRRHAD